MLSTARARLPVRNAALFLRPARLTFRRHKSKQVPTPWQKESVDEPMSTNFAEHTMFTIDFFVRFFKFSLVGLAALGLSTWTAFEGTHMWVEMVGLAPEKDEDVRRWEWHKEAERWLGREDGGTDPALGFKGRHAVRGAWMSLNWGIGSASSVLGSKAFSGQRPGGGGLNIVDARLEVAQDFMSIALRIAKERSANGKVRKDTVTELLARHASLLERMGTKDALFESRAQYERVWDAMGGRGIDAARVALKLGDLNSRLGDGADALVWWGKCMQLSQADASASSLLSSVPIVPKIFPSSPFAQRTLISSLISLSAYYATSGQLRQAQSVEEHSLEVLSQLPTPESLATASAPQALHALFVLHRSALLSIHLAEVHYALRTPPQSSIQWLTRAAQSSERVALALTGLPLIHPDAPESQIPHPPSSETPLLPAYAKSMSMSRPATSLLRDARRSAAEAWNLAGILYEGEGETTTTKRKGKRKEGDVEKALECYERALGWAGVAADRVGNVADPGEGTLEAEWRVLWGNYVRAREAVKKTSQP